MKGERGVNRKGKVVRGKGCGGRITWGQGEAREGGRTEKSHFGQKADTRRVLSGVRLRRIQAALSSVGREALGTGRELDEK